MLTKRRVEKGVVAIEVDQPIVYIRMKRKIQATSRQWIMLQDVAQISSPHPWQTELKSIKLHQLTKQDRTYKVLDSFHIISHLQQAYPQLEFQLSGSPETVVQVEEQKKKFVHVRLVVAWIILFVGTAMTIINFHYDVSMQEVHQKLHLLLTGDFASHPLWLQIPYSVGLGLGMILFLNHWFQKKINEEPSPLDIELFTYQRDLDQYIAYHENDLNDPDNHP